jgi:hypothetical protein
MNNSDIRGNNVIKLYRKPRNVCNQWTVYIGLGRYVGRQQTKGLSLCWRVGD